MPNTTEESENDVSPRSGRFGSIAALWNKFHFSGRVIMCSVLFGLGLVLVGGLVFVINMDDVSSNTNDSEKETNQLPTKPPSKYVGPVIMGIGGFIVTVGVIMCLFETQVCRKKTGDASPLISEKSDPEGKSSETLPGTSTSRSHKSHRHGARKGGTSPKRSKRRHEKSHSKERSQQKSLSPRTPPISIEKSMSYMTSSEEKFLTPPNTLREDVAFKPTTSPDPDNPSSSSIMKSFNSSGPSWNQSSEFLTPSTSFRDTSASLNNSVEVDENQQLDNFATDLQYMTPITVEEERIQKFLVKYEQKESIEQEMKQKTSGINNSASSENDLTTDSDTPSETVETGIKSENKIEDKSIFSDLSPSSVAQHPSDIKYSSQPHEAESENIIAFEEKNSNYEKGADVQVKNVADSTEVELENEEDAHVVCSSNSQVENDIDNKDSELDKKQSDMEKNSSISGDDEQMKSISDYKGVSEKTSNINNIQNDEENTSVQADEKEKLSLVNDSKPFLSERNHVLNLHSNNDAYDDSVDENDLEKSVSSDETITSADNFTEKLKINENEELLLMDDISNDAKIISASESLGEPADPKIDYKNTDLSVAQSNLIEKHDVSYEENDTDDKHSEAIPASKCS